VPSTRLLAIPWPSAREQPSSRPSRGRPTCFKPQSDGTDSVVGLGIGDGEGQAFAFVEPAALPVDPLQSLLCRVGCGKTADERDVRIVPQLEGEVYVVIGELAQND